jgi:hypothetical protein
VEGLRPIRDGLEQADGKMSQYLTIHVKENFADLYYPVGSKILAGEIASVYDRTELIHRVAKYNEGSSAHHTPSTASSSRIRR